MKKYSEAHSISCMIFGAILMWTVLYVTKNLAIGLCG